MMPAPEHNHGAHAHGTGHKWLDVIVAVSAIFISVVSLIVSIEHGRTMEKMVEQNQKMVEASTLPVLTEDTPVEHNPAGIHKGNIRLIVKNSGIGPAMIDRFEFSYKGKNYDASVPGLTSLLNACCAQALPKKETILPAHTSTVTGTVLPARESVTMLTIEAQSEQLMQALENAQADIKMTACYCSVLDQCWETTFQNERPKPVAQCQQKTGATLW